MNAEIPQGLLYSGSDHQDSGHERENESYINLHLKKHFFEILPKMFEDGGAAREVRVTESMVGVKGREKKSERETGLFQS